VYWDKDNNCVLDTTDPIVTSLADLTGGTNGASTAAGLDPREFATLFVKVAAPPGATPGMTDTTTLTATVTGTIGGVAAPTGIVATDTTAIVGSNLSLIKTQAMDANCDGTEEGSFATAALGATAVPGACIRYRVTATNAGGSNITSLLLNDAMPANTTYFATFGAAAVTVGTVTTVPAHAGVGAIQATVGTLTPGQVAVLSFGVRIDP
jgi:trimeric autotransporter adhesin